MRRNAGKVFLWVAVVACALVGGVGAVEPNYVRTTVYPQAEGIAPGATGYVHAPVTTTEYSDGLGRSLQSQLRVNDTKSIISGVEYDALGRPEKAVKPFPITTANIFYPNPLTTGANTHYNGSTTDQPQANGYAFSQTAYSDDPLGRITATGSPGAAFCITGNNHPKFWYFGVKQEATTNFDADGFVKKDMLTTAILATLTSYTAATHFLSVSCDADGKFQQVLTDIFGRKIATCSDVSIAGVTSRMVAKYSYDILGNVLKETPPGSSISPTEYEYNTLGQLKKKKTPDAGTVTYEYDDVGRLWYFQDANCGVDSCILNDYDDLGRVILVRKVLLSEKAVKLKGRPLIKRYYDDPAVFVSQESELIKSLSTTTQNYLNLLYNCRGRLVAEVGYTEYRISDNVSTIETGSYKGDAIVDIYGYDDEGRIKVKYKVVPGLPFQIFSFSYDNLGKLISEYYVNGPDRADGRVMVYDDLGRLKKVQGKQSLSPTAVSKDLVSYSYTEVGALKGRDFHGNTSTSSYLHVSQSYNIRDWLTNIACGPASKPFAEVVEYNGTTSGPFNGNIKSTDFSYPVNSVNSRIKQTYTYDDINRLTNVAAITENTPGGKSGADLAETFSYDVNGRFTSKATGSAPVKNYQYYDTDPTLKTSRLKTVSTTSNNYSYDQNGNTILDKTKKMATKYDWRNLPYEFIFFNTIPNIAWANGNTGTFITKNIEKDLIVNGAVATSRVVMLYDASGNRVYKNAY